MKKFELITKEEVIRAQEAWVTAVVEQDAEALLALYDFGSPEEPLLFKPTLTDKIRTDEAGRAPIFWEEIRITRTMWASFAWDGNA